MFDCLFNVFVSEDRELVEEYVCMCVEGKNKEDISACLDTWLSICVCGRKEGKKGKVHA